jgi:hypothetical protein
MPKQTPNVYQLALQAGLNPQTVYSRLRKGMTLQQALNGHPKGYFKRHWESNRQEMLDKVRSYHLKTYIATSPEGEQTTITDLPEWCAEQDLPYPSVSLYIRWGKPYKGWTIRKLSDATQEASRQIE